MLDKGYAETSITEIAKRADLSLSHLLYYYPSKEAILADLCGQVVRKAFDDVTIHRDEPPEERIHVLVDNVFIPGAVRKAELGIIRELATLATHQPEIRAQLSRFSDEMMAYLEDLFAKTPRQPGLSALDAAELAAGLWMGLVNNSAYHEKLDASRARRLFRRALLSLANLQPASAQVQSPRVARQRKPAAPGPRAPSD